MRSKLKECFCGYRLLFLIAAILISCKSETKKEEITSTTASAKFDWLLGQWQRVNEEEDKETYEFWKKQSDSLFNGFSFTLQKKDTIWLEHIKLVRTGEEWNYEVSGKGDTISTNFRLTEIGEETFTFENAQNEFPKKIQYFKKEERITAIISGGELEIPFEFEKIQD